MKYNIFGRAVSAITSTQKNLIRPFLQVKYATELLRIIKSLKLKPNSSRDKMSKFFKYFIHSASTLISIIMNDSLRNRNRNMKIRIMISLLYLNRRTLMSLIIIVNRGERSIFEYIQLLNTFYKSLSSSLSAVTTLLL